MSCLGHMIEAMYGGGKTEKVSQCMLLLEIPDAFIRVLQDLKIAIFTSPEVYYLRDFKNLLAPYIRIYNHNKTTFPEPYQGQPNVSENVLVGMEDMSSSDSYDNWTDVLIQLTQNLWGFDMDIMLMGGNSKKVYFRETLMLDQNQQRIAWLPLFRMYDDLKGTVEPP